MSGAPDLEFSLERDVVEVLELLLAMMGDMAAVQRNILEAVGELQRALLEREYPQPELDAPGGTDARRTSAGVRGQAHQSQLHSSRLIEQARELCARAERLKIEAAQLVRGAAGGGRANEVAAHDRPTMSPAPTVLVPQASKQEDPSARRGVRENDRR